MDDAINPIEYNKFLAKRKALQALIQRQVAVLDALNMTTWKADVEKLSRRVQSDNFKVLVMGEFNRGKSTFINSLLGQKVLPAFAIPTTAIINEVKWGEQPKALLHFFKVVDDTNKPPREVPVDEIGKYVVIKDSKPSYNNQQIVYDNPYEKVELFWPLDLCRDGVEIIDSPGLNEDIERQKITINYLTSIDAAIYIIACDFPVSRSETMVIETIKNAGHDDIFFICNRINMIDQEEQQLVKERCISLLSPFTKEGAKFVFFINARGALDGRLKGEEDKVKQSNILSLEKELKNFLATERGRIKLIRPITEMKASIREARRILPEREKLLHVDLETIQARYAKAQGDLDLLEQERQQISTRMTNFRDETRMRVQEAAGTFYRDIADNIATWTENHELQNKMTVTQVFSQEARERIVEEVTKFLTDKVTEESKAWQNSTLQPLLESRMSRLSIELDERMTKFMENLDQIRLDLTSDVPISISKKAAEQGKVSGMERLLAAAGGLLLGDISTIAMGAAFGFREMLTSLLQQFGILVIGIALIGWNPVILIPALLFGGGVQAVLKVNAINKKIRDAVAKEYAQKLRETRTELANSIASTVDEKLNELQDTLYSGLGREIQNVREQVDSIIKEKQQGQARVNEAISKLTATSKELDAIENEVDVLIEQVALVR